MCFSAKIKQTVTSDSPIRRAGLVSSRGQRVQALQLLSWVGRDFPQTTPPPALRAHQATMRWMLSTAVVHAWISTKVLIRRTCCPNAGLPIYSTLSSLHKNINHKHMFADLSLNNINSLITRGSNPCFSTPSVQHQIKLATLERC